MSKIRFGIRGIMMVTLVVAMTMAAGYQFYRAHITGDRIHLMAGTMILAIGPVALWALASLVTSFRR